jgi:hypothetical protein
MATYSNALLDIEEIVTRFLLKYKKPLDDTLLYVEHACNAVRDFNLYDGNLVVSYKTTLDATKKWIELPDDFLTFVDLVTPNEGAWWSFTRRDQIVTTTTTTAGVEGRNSAQGEGVMIDQPRVTGYGAKGGWNKFRYTIDLAARRIYIDGDDITEYIVLLYVSSGIKTSGATTVPDFLTPMIDAYLLVKETYWLTELTRERPMREQSFWNERMRVRNLVNSMSLAEWSDLFYSSFTQSVKR